MDNEAAVDEIFSLDGVLAQTLHDFRPRTAQNEMAKAVSEAIVKREILIAEAGTGTGKTFAYLVPAILWGGKVIISTGTKNLQEQLFLRDIPAIRKSLNAPVYVSLLKGRANYLCLYHLNRVNENGYLTSREDVKYLRAITRFAKSTNTGDKAEIAEVPENAFIWNSVTSTRETCFGSECAYYQDCFVVKARREALEADIVVVNHHLFFADLALRESGVAELLPAANTVIFDEAHQLPDIAGVFFGEFASTSKILDLCRDVLVEGLAGARDGAKWNEVVSSVEKAARDLRLTVSDDYGRYSVSQIPAARKFFSSIEKLSEELERLDAVLLNQSERSEVLAQCRNRCLELKVLISRWYKDAKDNGDAESVLWVEVFPVQLQLHRTPLSIAPIFKKQFESTPRAWVFTSATLAVKNNFMYFASRMGLQESKALAWASPFDFARQALLYVPRNLPEPNSSEYTDAVIDAAVPVIEESGGRVFSLCTTIRAVKHIGERLREIFFKKKWSYPLFVQGDSGRTELLDRFREAGHAVLVGSYSFWEGVDVRGEALSVVIIDRIPFAPPDDPVLSARIALMEKEGKNGFMDYQVPEAVMSLKQGAGRLIRDESDKGILMICDPRLINKRYGERIWQSLPPFSRTRDIEEVRNFLRISLDNN